MLTEEEKARILAEEVFRAEVRASLSVRNSSAGKDKVWQFLNSAFGLWLLSAVLLSGIGGAITLWQKKEADVLRRGERLEGLQTEISCRYLIAHEMVSKPESPTDLPKRVLLAPGVRTWCLTEFSGHNLTSLLNELARLLPSRDPRKNETTMEAERTQRMHLKWVDRPLSADNRREFISDFKLEYDAGIKAYENALKIYRQKHFGGYGAER